jgi:hypothetical protein
MFVMASAVGFNLITFKGIILKREKPLYEEKFDVPTSTNIDWKLVLGGSVFGIGWGLADLCPGPVFALMPVFSLEISVIFVIFLALG